MFKKALEIDKNYIQAYGNLSIALLKLGQKEEAKKVLEEALSRFPDNSDLKKLLEEIK